MKDIYTKRVIPAMQDKFGYKNKMAVPRIKKVVLNSSFGNMASGKTSEEAGKMGESIAKDMAAIAGQKPVMAKARKSIATFKLRKGIPVGVKVTLRGQKMYDFLGRLVNIVLPRSRDFQGLKKTAVDNTGNLSIGIAEHLFFPEISPEQSKVSFGLEITIPTSARSKEEGLELFGLLGFPFQA